MTIADEFDIETKYKLYRTVYEILHPTISKRNISNYKIILDEELLPVRVFYPKKVTNISKIMIYIHGDGKITNCLGEYSNICRDLALESDHLIIAIDYDSISKKHFSELYNKIYEDVFNLYKELGKNGILYENITLCGDSTGGNIVIGITDKLIKNDIKVSKEILFYPVVSLEYYGKTKFESIIKNSEFDLKLIDNLKKYFKNICSKKSDLKNEMLCPLLRDDYSLFPKTLVFTGNTDPLKDEGFEYYKRLNVSSDLNVYVEIAFEGHGFLNSKDNEVKMEIYEQIKKFYI